MKIQLVEHFAALAAHHAAWNQLLQHSPTNTIFQTFEWFASWWEVFGEDYDLRVFLGFEGDSLVAMAPLVASKKRRYGQPMTCLEFACTAPSDYADFLYRDRESLRGVVKALRGEGAWDVLDLDRIPSVSPTLPVLHQEFPGWRGTTFCCDVASAYVFGPTHDGSEILKKKSIRRHINSLRKAGTVAVRHLTQAELIEPELDAFFDQHVERRSQTATPSLFLDPRERMFCRRLTQQLAPHGRVLFTILTLDGQAVAFHYGFLYEQRLLWYKPAFSPRHAHLSPGEVLLAELFQYCRTYALLELDFTIGDTLFKERFTNVKRNNVKFQAFRNGFWQQLGHADRTVRERAKRVPLVRQLHTTWGRIRSRTNTTPLLGELTAPRLLSRDSVKESASAVRDQTI
jgi:CelD/BcsL family acetyltransferase involved in cellulose biosynthesis